MITIDDTWYERPPGVRDRSSAGGVVTRLDAEGRALVALVREQDYPQYVLPKGRIERGEQVEEAARREIAEEAGLTDLALLADLGQRSRLSFDRRQWITTRYFLFSTAQTDGRPTDTKHHYGLWWFPLDALPDMLWPEQRALLGEHAALIVQELRRVRGEPA
jgi:8-oxo-dGTP pyrophosphatase MutT (NUDIX family)